MRISDWSSDVCSSDLTYFNWKREVRRSDAVGDTAPAPGDWSPERLAAPNRLRRQVELAFKRMKSLVGLKDLRAKDPDFARLWINTARLAEDDLPALDPEAPDSLPWPPEPSRSADRSEEHTSELQSLMRTSYAVFCLKKKKTPRLPTRYTQQH